MSTPLLERLKLGGLLGKMFGGKRDLYELLGYTQVITYEHILSKYTRQDITSRVIDAPANALWDNPPLITAPVAGFDEAWKDVARKHNVWQTVSKADKLAGMGEYAIILIGTDTPGDLKNPVVRRNNASLLYLQPYAINTATISKLVGDPTNARYMLPELYQIQPGNELNSVNIRELPPTFEIHADRVVHVLEGALTNDVFGTPRGVKIYNLLEDLQKIVGGTAETFWLTANRGMQVDVDKEMDLTKEDAADLSDEIDEYLNQLRRVIRTRGVKINSLGSDTPNPKNVFEMVMSLVSGSTGIPKRILIGSEAGQLASEQDRSNWAERIEERRSSFGTPTITNLVMRLSSVGVLPPVTSEQIVVEWPDAFKLSPLERAQTSSNYARSAANLAKALEGEDPLMTKEEAREILGLNLPFGPNQASST